MENIDLALDISEEELQLKQWRQKRREMLIARSRAAVVRNQIVDAYTILEDIRFDYISDTAFREKIVLAKRELEEAIDDFLLDDIYWKNRIEEFVKQTPKEYDKGLKEWHNTTISSEGK